MDSCRNLPYHRSLNSRSNSVSFTKSFYISVTLPVTKSFYISVTHPVTKSFSFHISISPSLYRRPNNPKQ